MALSERATATLSRLERWGLARCPVERLATLEPVLQELSDAFTGSRPDTFAPYLDRPEALTAYALFFAPQTCARTANALKDLLFRLPRRPANGRPVRILDLGCGLGSAALAASDVVEDLVGAQAEITLVDHAANALAAARDLLPGAQSIQTDLARFAPPEGKTFNLILSSFAFNEAFPDPARAEAALRALAAALVPPSEDAPFPSAILLLEPVLHATTPRFLELRTRLADLPLYAPCPHRRPCPMLATQDGLCHDIRAFKPTRSMVLLNRRLFRQISGVKYVPLAFGAPGGPEAEGFGHEEYLRLLSPLERAKGLLACRACMGDGALRRIELPAAALTADRRHALLARQRGECAWLEGPLDRHRQIDRAAIQRTADLRFADEPPPAVDTPEDSGFSFSI